MTNKAQFFALGLLSTMMFLAPLQPKAEEFISLGVGYYDINDDEGAADFRLEYRTGIPIMVENFNPWLGAEVTAEGSIWAGGGVLYDWDLQNSWHIVPSFGAGLYSQGGSDKDLDYPLEFRSQIETAYEFTTGQRAGLAVGHISNASLGDNNPGTEILNLYWHIPY